MILNTLCRNMMKPRLVTAQASAYGAHVQPQTACWDRGTDRRPWQQGPFHEDFRRGAVEEWKRHLNALSEKKHQDVQRFSDEM